MEIEDDGTITFHSDPENYDKEIADKNCIIRELERAEGGDFYLFAECSKAEFYAFIPPQKRSKMGYWVAKLLSSKRATIAGLEARGVHVCWQGYRKESTLSIRPAAEQWICKNYEKVFGL